MVHSVNAFDSDNSIISQNEDTVNYIADNDSMLPKEDIVNSYFTRNNEKHLLESEDFANERNGRLLGDSERVGNESAGKKAERISNYKQTLKGKTSAERKISAKEFIRGYLPHVLAVRFGIIYNSRNY